MFFWISCLTAGMSLYLLVWVCTRPLAQAAVPARQGSSRVMRTMVWPWVLALAPACRPFIPWRTRHLIKRRLTMAGLDRDWKPEHIVAMQMLGSLTLAAMAVVTLLVNGLSGAVWSAAFAGLIGLWWPRRWLYDVGRARQTQMLRELPFLLDVTTLCVEGGLNLQGALQQAAQHGPEGPLRSELRYVLGDIRAGMTRKQALDAWADRTGLAAIHGLVAAVNQADQLGMSLGPLLRSQSEQRRVERFLRAEKLALEAPVKMLFPMVLCIFPCTFLIIGFPLAMKLFAADL